MKIIDHQNVDLPNESPFGHDMFKFSVISSSDYDSESNNTCIKEDSMQLFV